MSVILYYFKLWKTKQNFTRNLNHEKLFPFRFSFGSYFWILLFYNIYKGNSVLKEETITRMVFLIFTGAKNVWKFVFKWFYCSVFPRQNKLGQRKVFSRKFPDILAHGKQTKDSMYIFFYCFYFLVSYVILIGIWLRFY